jgi:hypothetical protein
MCRRQCITGTSCRSRQECPSLCLPVSSGKEKINSYHLLHRDILGVAEDFLAMEALHGKPVKVRILGFRPRSDNVGAMEIPDGCMALTVGKPVSGEPPEIEVRPMIPGRENIFVPLRNLAPVHPGGTKENAVVIGGEHLGKEVIVENTREFFWKLKPADGTGAPLLRAPPEHLIVRSRIKP